MANQVKHPLKKKRKKSPLDLKLTESMSNLVEDFVKFLRQRCLEMANQVKHKKKKLKKMTFRTVNTLHFMQQRLLDKNCRFISKSKACLKLALQGS